MFRQRPDPKVPFSGWVFLSEKESQNASRARGRLEFHDPLTILRLMPEAANYLDLPPGTTLVRGPLGTFERIKL